MAKQQSDENSTLGEFSQLLKAIGDELRLEILRVLARDSFGVLELCRLFDVKQSGMSHHLKVLATAGLVGTRKEGNSIFYQRTSPSYDHPYAGITSAVFSKLDSIPLSDATKANLDSVHLQRSQASQHFFSENADRFKQQQDLIAAFDVYGTQVAETLEKASLPSREVALEIGPGHGEFLEALCHRFTHTTALDNSQTMLRSARQLCQEKSLTNVDFVHADTAYCRTIADSVDCAVINMVLHHTASPQAIFEDVSIALKPGGVMIVCDLCQHDQDWTREACGDLWLGFAPDDLSAWARALGLREGHSSYFALRNGFQIQIREFINP